MGELSEGRFEATVESLDPIETTPLATSQMEEIPGTQAGVGLGEDPRPLDVFELYREDESDSRPGETEGGIESFQSADGKICVEQLLEHLGRSAEASAARG